MATRMKLIETFKESAEREQIQAMIEELMQIEDDTVTSVEFTVKTVNPDGTENSQSVAWSRRYEHVEE